MSLYHGGTAPASYNTETVYDYFPSSCTATSPDIIYFQEITQVFAELQTGCPILEYNIVTETSAVTDPPTAAPYVSTNPLTDFGFVSTSIMGTKDASGVMSASLNDYNTQNHYKFKL